MLIERGGVGEYVLIFLVGVLWDGVISVDTIVTAQFKWFPAFWTTLIVSMLPYWMLDRILEESKVNWSKALTLSLGSGLGASLSSYILGLVYR